MRWCLWTQMEDFGRMESRVMQVLDRVQATVVTISSTRLDDRIFMTCIVEVDERPADLIDRLLRKIHGMISVKVLPEANTTQRMIALFRIISDISDRAEVLQFVHAVNARAIMVRPMWIAFELVGTPEEVEGVYQSALGYGIVDVVSSSCAFMTSANDSERIAVAMYDEEPEAVPALPAGLDSIIAPAGSHESRAKIDRNGNQT